MKKYFSALLIILLSSFTTAPRIVWLDELDLSNVDQSAGKAIANQSMWKTPLSIAGEKFDRGVGTHAASVFRIKLDGKTVSFKASAGIDDSDVCSSDLIKTSQCRIYNFRRWQNHLAKWNHACRRKSKTNRYFC